MKKKSYIAKLGLISYWALLPWCLSAQAQDPYTGMWEGNFMEQFKTVILLEKQDNKGYAGKILMYSGENRIQDDELSKIIIESRNISFDIPAKESSFKGSFNETNTEFSGSIIFPDNTKHPLAVRKYEKDSLAVETAYPSLKEKFKEDLKKSFPAEELKSDFRELINKIKEFHPRLYSYTSESSFDKQANEILENLDGNLSMEQFYYRIAPQVASVKCSHTGIRMPPVYEEYLQEESLFFPLELYIQGQKAFYLSAPGLPGVELDAGCEIISINKRPVDQIIAELLDLIPAEGNGVTRKYQVLNSNFHSYFHQLNPSLHFSIDYTAADSPESIELDAMPYPRAQRMNPPVMSEQPYSFQIHGSPETGILKVSTFGIRDMEDYFAFLDSTFITLKESEQEYLLLDLRDNQGGHPIFAAQLLSYLTDNEFTYLLQNPDVEEFEPLYQPMQANPQNFTGTLYVLVNGNCLSTTGHLISLLKYHTDAIFVGEEPGSTFLCNDFSFQSKLSHTGIEVNIPRTTFITAVSGFKDGEPFPMDYELSVPVQDLLAGKDTFTAFVYELLGEESLP